MNPRLIVALYVAGLVLVVGGLAVAYWPAAVVALGAAALVVAWTLDAES